MGKHCHTPDGVREAICKMFQNGVKVSEIARNLSMPRTTVSNIVQKFKKTGESSRLKPQGGRKQKLSIRQQRILGRMISANRKLPKQKILDEFNLGSDVKISMSTLERYSKKNCNSEKSPRKKAGARQEALPCQAIMGQNKEIADSSVVPEAYNFWGASLIFDNDT